MEVVKHNIENDSMIEYASLRVRHDVDWNNRRVVATVFCSIKKNIELKNDLFIGKRKYTQYPLNKKSKVSSSEQDLVVLKKKHITKQCKKKLNIIQDDSNLYDSIYHLLQNYKKNAAIDEALYDKLIKLIDDLKNEKD